MWPKVFLGFMKTSARLDKKTVKHERLEDSGSPQCFRFRHPETYFLGLEPGPLSRSNIRNLTPEHQRGQSQARNPEPTRLAATSGKLIRGDLQDLNWTNLEFLDLQRASAVTGSLSDINIPEDVE